MKTHGAVGILVVALTGCGASDGAVGAKSRVRFSHVFQFAETDGFDAAIAQGATTLIELQDATSGSQEPANAPQFTLVAKPIGHEGTATVLPLGFARSAVQLQGIGVWRLEALAQGRVVDELAVHVAPASRLRVGADATVETRGATCTKVTTERLEGVVLRPNQSVSLYVVPLDELGKPMTGLLPLSAEASPSVRLTTPPLLPVTQPNQLTVQAVALDGATETISVSAPGAGQLGVAIRTSTVASEPSCD